LPVRDLPFSLFLRVSAVNFPNRETRAFQSLADVGARDIVG